MNINKHIDLQQLEIAIKYSEKRLLKAKNSTGFWEGYLSSSAVSTSVACFALWKYDKVDNQSKIIKAIEWLCTNINNDGGWGDSPESDSNLSATLLAWSALSIVKSQPKYSDTINKCEKWLSTIIGKLEPQRIIEAILNHYGKDKTFSVPILMFCTLAGRLGDEPECWEKIPQLPYEFALFPHQFYKMLNLSVVSYALPALISIGFVKHRKSPEKFLPLKFIREKAVPKVMQILEGLQPGHGGFLEAAPLTGFVTMSLASTELKDHNVTHKGTQFLTSTQRDDGSWPIDTNLAAWVTTLSIKALDTTLNNENKKFLVDWLLKQQFQKKHYFTHSPAGGWGWTNLYGRAPDGDDTPGAIIALKTMYNGEKKILDSVEKGIKWLIKLQNRDGGIPTFCKGWGKLPFDQSCPGLTAHAIQALWTWKSKFPKLEKKLTKSVKAMVKYLANNQYKEGYWLPLWFGNQWNTKHENPIYGTSIVVLSLQSVQEELPVVNILLKKAYKWLFSSQNNDSAWGNDADGYSTIEETSLALSALAGQEINDRLIQGYNWLIEKVSHDEELPASPIGLYFASLWYSEKMYPIVYSHAALKTLQLNLKS